LRCPDRILAAFGLALLTLAGPALAAADAVRAEITAKLKNDLPALAPADYVLGSAAFDADLRSQLAEMQRRHGERRPRNRPCRMDRASSRTAAPSPRASPTAGGASPAPIRNTTHA
jgi:hypothetical protein